MTSAPLAARPLGIVRAAAIALVCAIALTPAALAGAVTPPHAVRAAAPSVTAADEDSLRQAAAYDASLSDGQLAVGEAPDPFSGGTQPAYQADADYQRQLGRGPAMASIRIPRIGVSLGIGHGTGAGTLETQAGHMYGTTLPVGDPGNSVIAAHRGLGARLLFYRVGELSAGDMIYTTARGRTVAWRVSSTRTVEPGSDEERLALGMPSDGRTLLTLYTCDPPGLNTRRLVVTAERVPYDPSTPVAGQIDPLRFWIAYAAAAAAALIAFRASSPPEPGARHASGSAS